MRATRCYSWPPACSGKHSSSVLDSLPSTGRTAVAAAFSPLSRVKLSINKTSHSDCSGGSFREIDATDESATYYRDASQCFQFISSVACFVSRKQARSISTQSPPACQLCFAAFVFSVIQAPCRSSRASIVSACTRNARICCS